MKVCEKCEREIYTTDGDNTCVECERSNTRTRKRRAARQRAKEIRDALEGIGLTRVRGALGGVYWE